MNMKMLSIAAILLIAVSCGNGNRHRTPDEVSEDIGGTETGVSAAEDVPGNVIPAEETSGSEEDVVKTEIVNNEKPSIIDFNATWCAPCRMMKPVFHKLAREFKDEYNFISIDIDEHPELAEKYQIQAVPTFVFLDADGNEGNRKTGAIPEADLRDELLNPAWF